MSSQSLVDRTEHVYNDSRQQGGVPETRQNGQKNAYLSPFMIYEDFYDLWDQTKLALKEVNVTDYNPNVFENIGDDLVTPYGRKIENTSQKRQKSSIFLTAKSFIFAFFQWSFAFSCRLESSDRLQCLQKHSDRNQRH